MGPLHLALEDAERLLRDFRTDPRTLASMQQIVEVLVE